MKDKSLKGKKPGKQPKKRKQGRPRRFESDLYLQAQEARIRAHQKRIQAELRRRGNKSNDDDSDD